MLRPFAHRLLSVLLLGAAARAADPPMPYGPVALPEVKHITVTPDRALTLTVAALTYTVDVPTRVRLVADLGLIGTDAAKAQLVKLLTDPEPLLRAQAVRGLVSRTEIDALAGDSSPLVRREVAAASANDAVAVKLLNDDDVAVRLAAMNRSGSPQYAAAIAALLPKLSPYEQAFACRTLARQKSADSVAAIEPLLASPSLVSRIAAIDALAAMQKLSADELGPQLAHPHPAVRRAAVAALVSLALPQRLGPATTALADADIEVRIAGATILLDAGTAASVAPLLKQFPPDDDQLTKATRTALASIAARDPAAKTAVDTAAADLLTSSTPGLRADGSFLLGALASKSKLTVHIALLNDADWEVVRTAAISLGQIGDAAAGAPLAAAARRAAGMGDADFAAWYASATPEMQSTRTAAGEQAILSCVALRYVPVIAAVEPLVEDRTALLPMRLAAIWAIGVMQPPEAAAPHLGALLGRMGDIKESAAAVLEAAKAAGNARVASLEGALTAARDTGGWPLSGVAMLSLDRIHGIHTPLEPPTYVEAPMTAIRDITPAAK